MCTLIVNRRPDATPAVQIGANRDESLRRPSRPPELVDDGPISVLAPRDERAGGTWLGLNAEGVFAGITNRFAYPLDPNRRSRGEIVFRALRDEDASSAASRLGELDPTSYNPFHLVVVDPQAAFVCVSDGSLSVVTPLTGELAVVTERSYGAAANPRKRYVMRRLLQHPASRNLEGFRAILSESRPGSIDSVCVDLGEVDYGTRSSTLLSYGGEPPTFLHAEGPPSSTDYEDLTELAVELLG